MPKPYTVKFGQWLPDLQDVGVEMPFQWTETELPVADCENVYWQDAAYRCLPAPDPFASSLGIPILACFTWYDNTAGKEIVFATTASGVYQLVDNVWTQIPVQQNASAGTIGYAISLGMGVPFAVAVNLSGDQSAIGTATSHTFSSVSAACGNLSEGFPTNYNWTFSGQSGAGTWSLASGQGTSVAVPQVTGVTPDDTTSVTLNCAITVNSGTYSCSCALQYQNAPSPQQMTFTSGSGTVTVPAGLNTVVIEVGGGGGGGEGGEYNSGTHQSFGGDGGDSGTYCRSSYSCSAGETIHYSVGAAGTGGAGGSFGAPGAGGTSTASSGTLSITTMSAPGGNTGNPPSGGNQANTTFNAGTAGGLNTRGTGGAAISGVHANGAAGGNGGLGVGAGSAGGSGIVSFYFSFV